MSQLPLQQYEQCGRVLVEEDVTPDEAAALPNTAVHVERTGSQASHFWQFCMLCMAPSTVCSRLSNCAYGQ
jgi:hypothetical protein